MKYQKIVIGIDQSYQNTGISIAADGKLVKITSIPFRGLRSKSEKRKHLSKVLYKLLTKISQRASECIIICERIRTFSKGFLNTNYIKSTGALIAVIVDIAYEFNIPVYSVDTRSWKSQIVGTSKGGKLPTLKYVKSLGFDVGKNDDAADSACIALYGFLPKEKQKLKKET